MKLYATIIILLVSMTSQALAEECDGFVSWVTPAKDAYFQKHRIYPIPDHIQKLAKQYMPRLWVHPQSWQPIDFEEYLAKSKLVRKSDKSILKTSPSARYLANLDQEEQCSLYLDAGEITPNNPAPIYIQAFWDENPADPGGQLVEPCRCLAQRRRHRPLASVGHPSGCNFSV
jgi:hypothetical protein